MLTTELHATDMVKARRAAVACQCKQRSRGPAQRAMTPSTAPQPCMCAQACASGALGGMAVSMGVH